MLSLIEKSWTKLKIDFDVKDPLQKTGRSFDMPQLDHKFPPHLKQRLTICNLFVNYAQSVDELAKYFDMPPSQIIGILIEEGFLKDQRKRQQRAIKNGRRQTDRTIDLAEIGPMHSQFSQ